MPLIDKIVQRKMFEITIENKVITFVYKVQIAPYSIVERILGGFLIAAPRAFSFFSGS